MFLGGLVFKPDINLFDAPLDLLAVLVGPVVFLAGVVWGVVLAVQSFRGPGTLSERLGWPTPAGYGASDDDYRGRRSGDDRRGPAVNVDGTPMANAHVDVNGNAYGFSDHRHDAGGFSSGGSFGGGFSNSRW